MRICNRDHPVIAFEAEACPMCHLENEWVTKNADLEQKCCNFRFQIDALEKHFITLRAEATAEAAIRRIRGV